MVLTSERFLLTDTKMPINHARTKMLKQMITSTTTGWFNLYLKENFKRFIDEGFPDFFKERLQKLK
jgi:hypothetical protein